MSQAGLWAQQGGQEWPWSWGREGSGKHESFLPVS